MEKWTTVLALVVAGAIVAGPAWAQQTKPGDLQAPAKPTDKSGDTSKSGDTPSSPSKSDAGSGSTSSSGTSAAPSATYSSPGTSSGPSASPSTSGGTSATDSMKSDTMKSEGADKSARGGNAEHVKAAQQALKDKGHDPGTIDGVMGPKTKAALKDFQKAEGLKESGMLDSETMAKLGVEAKSSALESTSPSASPSTGTK